MNNNIFDIEQEINNCWTVTSDIKNFIWRQYDSPDGPLTDDEAMNILLGIVAIYDMRFEKLTDVYSRAVLSDCQDDMNDKPE